MMTDTPPKGAISNGALARATGMNHSMVSRLRSGLRNPSIVTMGKVERLTGWKLEAQARALHRGEYANEFEAALVRKYGEDGGEDD